MGSLTINLPIRQADAGFCHFAPFFCYIASKRNPAPQPMSSTMAFKVQVLADTKRRWQSAVNMKTRNRVWLNIAQVSRLSVAERIAANLRIDSSSIIVRIRPMERA
jgi:hypothetical protein